MPRTKETMTFYVDPKIAKRLRKDAERNHRSISRNAEAIFIEYFEREDEKHAKAKEEAYAKGM